MTKKSSAVYIFDMDEVIVDISYEMYSRIKANWVLFSNYLVDPMFTVKSIHERDDFYIDRFMKKDNLSDEEEKELKELITKYVFTNTFYDTLLPTKLAEGTLRNPAFINNKAVKKVFILTRYTTDEMKESKERFLEKYFSHSKIDIIYVPSNKKKSDFLKERNIEWDVFIDDELSNIQDFAESFNLEGKEFLIPEFGYNRITPELSLLIEGKGGTVSFYDPQVYWSEEGN